MKLTFKLYSVPYDEGDGSASTLTFSTYKEAEKEIQRQEDEEGYSIADGVSTKTIVVDTKAGTLTMNGMTVRAV